jgi:hypothetical protein
LRLASRQIRIVPLRNYAAIEVNGSPVRANGVPQVVTVLPFRTEHPMTKVLTIVAIALTLTVGFVTMGSLGVTMPMADCIGCG